MKNKAPFLKLSAAERKGILTLCLLIVVLFGIRISLPYLFPEKPEPPEFTIYLAKSSEKDSMNAFDFLPKQPVLAKELFAFDPNSATKETLLQLGFKPYLAERMIKYREKVGRFRTKDDVRKIYGMREDFYVKISPYLLLPDHAPENSSTTKKPARATQRKREINLLDSAGLDSLKGVSAYFASKIKNYHDRLGGFYSLDQLGEIYKPHAGDTVDWLTLIKAQLSCDPSYIQKLKINAETSRIFKHPYIGYKKAKVLLQYKKEHGEFLSMEDLRMTRLFSGEELEKIRFYIDFER